MSYYTHYNLGGSQGQYTALIKPVQKKDFVLYDLIYIAFLK